MSIALTTVEVRHERRIRLTFTNSLAIGAYNVALYTVVNTDGRATSPSVVAAMLIPGMPNNVELALGTDLVPGAAYAVSANGVPASDLSVTPTPSTEQFVYGAKIFNVRTEPKIRDRERLVLQEDIIWNGLDFQESPTGDLATVAGKPNVTKGIWRSIETSGLPWDPAWGVDVREYVDSPSAAAGTLKGAISAQILRDERIARVSSKFVVESDSTIITFTPILKGGETLEPVSQTVPND